MRCCWCSSRRGTREAHPTGVSQTLGDVARPAKRDWVTSGVFKTLSVAGGNLHCCPRANPPSPMRDLLQCLRELEGACSLAASREFSRKIITLLLFWLNEASFLASCRVCHLTGCVSRQGGRRRLLRPWASVPGVRASWNRETHGKSLDFEGSHPFPSEVFFRGISLTVTF